MDKSPYCAYGKSVGQCSSANQMISDYMKKHCKKSCDLCKGNDYDYEYDCDYDYDYDCDNDCDYDCGAVGDDDDND